MARSATWTISDFQRYEAAIKAELAALPSDTERLSYLLTQLAVPTTINEANVLRAITLGILALEIHGRSDGMNQHDAKKLVSHTELMLRSNGIKPGTSRLSFLFGRIAKAEGAARLRRGDTLGAATSIEIARHLSYRPDEAAEYVDRLDAGKLNLRLGHSQLAVASASAALSLATLPEDAARALALKASALRLSGAEDAAQLALQDLPNGKDRDWELTARALRSPETAGAAAARMFRRRDASFEDLLMTKLWLAAGRSKAARDSAPKTQSLKRRQELHVEDATRIKRLSQAAQTFDEAYDGAIPLADRLLAIADACSYRNLLPTVESELLVTAAAYRHAQHYQQKDLAQLYFAEYQAICLALSSGRQGDVLELGSTAEPLAREPATGLDRVGKMAQTAGQVALITVSSRLKRLVASEDDKQRIADQEIQALGEVLLTRLSELKGGLMKVGQYFSNVEGIPEDLKSILALLRHSAEPMPSLAVDRELRAAFGDPARVFAEWDPTPFAVASISQIHRARLRDGDGEVAVKVQHPGIKEAIRSDLSALGLLRPVLQRWMPATDVKAMLAELSERLLAETDFRLEATVQARFHEIFAKSDQAVVPAVHATASTDNVIVMDLVRGRRYDDFVATATQEEKDAAGITIARMYFTALLQHGLFNCDPHPGNYLFLDDGRVAFLDFGCSRTWDPKFVQKFFAEPFRLLLANDFQGCQRLSEELGYNKTSGKFDFKAHWDLLRAMYEPLLTPGPRRLDRAYLQRLNFLHTNSPNLKTASPPAEALMLLRVTFGLLNILVELGSEADWHTLAVGALRGSSESHPHVAS